MVLSLLQTIARCEKKSVFSCLLACIAFPAIGQVQVKPASFIYSKGSNIYVKDAITLEGNSHIYLRKEAQLVQGNNVPNAGTGNLSVFQEGAANNFTYNYWSAPVGVTTGTGNQGFLYTQLKYPVLQPGFKANTVTSTNPYSSLSTNLVTAAEDPLILPIGDRDGLTDLQTVAGSTITQTRRLSIASRWLHSYPVDGTGYGSWRNISVAPSVAAGYGFTMKGVTPSTDTTREFNLSVTPVNGIVSQRYDFRGRPNNGNIQVQIRTDAFSLVGNPYPSALDLKKFLIDNTNVDGSGILIPSTSKIDSQILFWESIPTTHLLVEYDGGYASYIPGSRNLDIEDGMYTPATYKRYDASGNVIGNSGNTNNSVYTGPVSRRYAAVGQGFVITRKSASGFTGSSQETATFNNSQRRFFKENGNQSIFQLGPGGGTVTQSTPFVRSKINLTAVVNDLYVRSFILAFGNDSTDGLDWGLEAVIDHNLQINDVYMPQDGQRLIIKTIPFDVTKKIPVGFVLRDPSTFELSVASLEQFDTPLILLHDTLNGAVYDLKNGTATIALPAGTYNDRFEIVFQQPATLSTGSALLSNAIDVFQNNNQQLLTVFNPTLREIKNIALYDLAGRSIVSQQTTAQDSYTFDTATYSSGIYLVKITDTSNNSTTEKVSISN